MRVSLLFSIMVLFSRSWAFQPSLSSFSLFKKPTSIIMRMRKTFAHQNYDSDTGAGSGSGASSGSGRSSRKMKNLAPLYKPRSENQRLYVQHLTDPDTPIVFGIGPAGCGKTLCACTSAIDGLKRGEYQKIVLTRPIVPVEEEELGFLPGTLNKKMDPWTRPLMDIFLEHYPQHELEFMLGSGMIEISPLAYMRGRTFKRCFIIADEMQNSTPNQMLMLTTRIGEKSKMVITGDLKQSDRSLDNGLRDIMRKIKMYKGRTDIDIRDVGIEMVEMNKGDIERSPIVARILDIFNYNKQPDQLPVIDDSMIRPFDTVHEVEKKEEAKEIIKNNDCAMIPISELSKHFPNELH